MNEGRRIVHEALSNVRVIDPHCHLRAEKPCADSLADIVLYHHAWIELVSSGMPQHEVTRSGLPHELADPGIPPFERVRRALKYLHNIESTTTGLYLRWILHDLYGVDALTEQNLESVYGKVQDKATDEQWQTGFLEEYCGIERCITVESDSPTERVLIGNERVLQNLADGKRSSLKILASMEDSSGRSINTAQDYRDSLKKTLDKLPVQQLKFVNVWPTPYLSCELAAEEDITRTIRKVKNGQAPSPAEVGGFSYFGIVTVLEALKSTRIRTIQLIAGAEVLPPHRSITHWNSTFCGAVARLACSFEDFHFSISSASDVFTQDIGILAKHIPNISVLGYWWHTLYPFYIKKALETRLDMVPLNKIVGYFSDAYHAEWCYPKLKIVKQIVEEILTERIYRGWYTVDIATDVVRKLFYENPKAIYAL
ncbi:MAG: hypothetical protein MUQ10_06350 [Anaerolineae bacterium]|nr:hypothetical protein [Anaerolineae bacterium]